MNVIIVLQNKLKIKVNNFTNPKLVQKFMVLQPILQLDKEEALLINLNNRPFFILEFLVLLKLNNFQISKINH